MPLIYQVATAALSPADIAEPIPHILSDAPNISVVMGRVAGVEPGTRRVRLMDGCALPYDRLVLATGSTSTYFGRSPCGWQASGSYS